MRERHSFYDSEKTLSMLSLVSAGLRLLMAVFYWSPIFCQVTLNPSRLLTDCCADASDEYFITFSRDEIRCAGKESAGSTDCNQVLCKF